MNTKSTFEDAVKVYVDNLIKSPTFAMSLGAKELFHTNFLAFLLETTDASILSISKILKKRLLGNGFEGDVLVLREKNNFDLVVLPKSSESVTDYSSVIIEAKMKSIPTMEQLTNYSNKIANGFKVEVSDGNCVHVVIDQNGTKYRLVGKEGNRFWSTVQKTARKILLAPTRPFEQETWEFMEWSTLNEDIKRGLKLGQEDEVDSTVPNVVKSYANDLDNILEILNRVDKYVEGFCQRHSDLQLGDFDSSLKEVFSKLRIYDLVAKYSYWRLSQKLLKFVVGANFEVGFTNGTPLLHIWKHLANQKYKIGVQIQDSQFRHFMESKTADDGLRAFVKDGDYISNWFNKIAQNSSGDIESIEQLNKFDANKFLYSKVDVASYSFSQLSERLNKSFLGCPI